MLGDDKASAQQRCQHGHEAHRVGNRQVAADGPNHPAIASGSVLPSGLRERSQAALTDVMATPLTCIWQRAEHGQNGIHRHCMLRHGKTVAAVLRSMTAWWQLELRHAVSCLHTDGQRCCETITGKHQRRQPWTADQRAQLAVGLRQPQSGASPEEAHRPLVDEEAEHQEHEVPAHSIHGFSWQCWTRMTLNLTYAELAILVCQGSSIDQWPQQHQHQYSGKADLRHPNAGFHKQPTAVLGCS